MGKRDDELYIRWLQFGVVSPINRLHSTSNEFLGKEPWKFSKDTQKNATELMRLRHRLIPYTYTMNMLTHRDGRPLMEPMYYENPHDDAAYTVPNEYWFGTELIAAPITSKCNRKTLTASADVWLPEGRYTDIFTGRIYKGGKKIKMFRDMASFPLLAKEGAIIPLAINDRNNDCSNPEDMELLIYRGNNSFTLYEDDGETMNYKSGAFAQTKFEVEEKDDTVTFVINPAEGDLSQIPVKRRYVLSFNDISACEKLTVSVNGKRATAVEKTMTATDGTVRLVAEISSTDRIKITFRNITARKNPDKKEAVTDLLSKVQGSNNAKMILYTSWLNKSFKGAFLADKVVKDAVNEIFEMYYE